jgi:hypothetical protein
VIKDELAIDPGFRARFRQEAAGEGNTVTLWAT